MKIDLHCHTKKIKKGDPITRNVSSDIFSEKIQNADVKIVAITNHNAFDLQQYNELKDKVRENCDVWPGIELDAFGDQKKKDKPVKFHLIVVANPIEVNRFKKVVDELLEGFDVNNDSKHITEICEAFKELDILFIPHYMGKVPAISEDDLVLLRSLVPDSTKVFTETTESSIGVLVNNDFHALVGSDVRDWNDYESSMFSDLRLPVSSFEQFCMLAKRDNVVINTILNKKKSYVFPAKPHAKVTIQLRIFEDVNIIFGQKGTGKSEILNSLIDVMTGEGLKCVKYVGSQKEDGFKHLLSTSDMSADSELLSANNCEEEFKALMGWKDSSITLFSQYIKWFETRNNNSNKKTMRITEAVDISLPDESKMRETQKEWKLLTDAQKKINQIDIDKYLESGDKELLEEIIQKLENSIHSAVLEDYGEYKAIQLTNYSIDKIKELADKKTDTVSKPSSTGFLEYAHSHLLLKKSTKKILDEIKKKPFYSDRNIGELEGKGQIFVRSLYRMLCTDSRTAEFKIGITVLKNIKNMLEEINRKYYSADIASCIGQITEILEESGVSTIESFIGLSKSIVDCHGMTYEPSNGEKGILLLQQVIKGEADAYFFDEPELGMGNSYIDATIRPQISDLARRHKIVIVATHNANLAVRTLPYMSIFRKYENGDYFTYTGNPFRNELVNIDDNKDLLNWTVESMHTLEGGKEAFYERKDIYESGSN